MTITGISCTSTCIFVYYFRNKDMPNDHYINKGYINQQPVDNFSENICWNIVAVFTEMSNFTP